MITITQTIGPLGITEPGDACATGNNFPPVGTGLVIIYRGATIFRGVVIAPGVAEQTLREPAGGAILVTDEFVVAHRRRQFT